MLPGLGGLVFAELLAIEEASFLFLGTALDGPDSRNKTMLALSQKLIQSCSCLELDNCELELSGIEQLTPNVSAVTQQEKTREKQQFYAYSFDSPLNRNSPVDHNCD